MPSLEFITIDVFTKTRYEGNPLAIVKIPDGVEVSTKQMQTIAREFNLSETLFIYTTTEDYSDKPTWRIRIFFPTSELPFAGHPTIGAACYALGTLSPKTEKATLLCNAGPIAIRYLDGAATAGIPHNFHRHVENFFPMSELYDLQPALKGADTGINIISPVKGMNFIAVQLVSLNALAAAQKLTRPVKVTLDEGWRQGFVGTYFWVLNSYTDGTASIRARMMEVALEDPATGSAACALAMCLALRWRNARQVIFEIVQGVEMGRKSEIGVVVRLDEKLERVEEVSLVGAAVKVMEGTVEYD